MRLGLNISGYYYILDINMGMDTSKNFNWITSEGRDIVILNSTELTYEEKSMLLTNNTLT